MDAVPVTLGQEFGGYAAQVRLGIQRVEATLRRVGQIPLGGTATGTGLNTHPEFAAKVREKLAGETGLEISEPLDPFEAQGNRDALVELSGALKVYAVSLNKIANDLALMGSGPRAGLAELRLPELQKGSSIMPGKVNPVIPEVVIQVAAQVIGNDAAITVAGSQGQFELNVRVPLIARNLLDSIKLLASASRLLEREVRRRDRGQRGDDRRATPRRPWPRRPRSTPTSATTAPPTSSRRRPSRAARSRGRARAGRRALGARGGARPPPHGAAARVEAGGPRTARPTALECPSRLGNQRGSSTSSSTLRSFASPSPSGAPDWRSLKRHRAADRGEVVEVHAARRGAGGPGRPTGRRGRGSCRRSRACRRGCRRPGAGGSAAASRPRRRRGCSRSRPARSGWGRRRPMLTCEWPATQAITLGNWCSSSTVSASRWIGCELRGSRSQPGLMSCPCASLSRQGAPARRRRRR